MFSKQQQPAKRTARGKPAVLPPLAAESQARRSPKVASLVSEDLVVTGGLASEGEAHIDGKVIGDVKVSRLTLGEAGQVEGSITGEMVEIRGRVAGPITAKLVRLFATSHVEGDITHEQLAMETGAHFQGRSLKLQRPAPASAPQPVSGVIALNPAAAI